MNCNEYELFCLILNPDKTAKALRIGKAHGSRGATVLRARGTIHSGILNFLGLYDETRELVLIGADKQTANEMRKAIAEELEMEKPNHGIGFSIPLTNIIGTKSYQENIEKKVEESPMDYKLIITIVDRGKAEQVIDSAKSAGSQGGTIISGRGSGIHETQKIFNIEIEPEKEIVLIIAQNDKVDDITNVIRKELHIDEPGKGIIFVTEVTQTIGLFKGK
ncbi:MAG: P-II family nitrogen regulator [Bacilli bacterium]|nr:P-II family nitrogen regulator [Bacilli bacterium]